MLLNDKGAARLVITLVAVLWKSDTEGLAVLARRVADGLSEGVGEVRLIGVQVEMMAAKGLLQPQHLQQIVSVVASVRKAVTPATSVSIWLNSRFTQASGTAW